MKQLVLVFAALGVASGLLFAIEPFVGSFVIGTPAGSLWSFIAPVILGLLVVATHVLNWRRLRDPQRRYPRRRLLAFNVALLVFFLIGFVFMYRSGSSFPRLPWLMLVFLALWPLPLLVNAIYLCAPEAAELRQ